MPDTGPIVGIACCAASINGCTICLAEHGMVMQTLTRVEKKIDGHIADHAKGEFNEIVQIPVVRKKRK